MPDPTFRTSRFIFDKIEEIAEGPQGKLLLQCMGIKSRKNDLYSWRLSNGSKIVAIPLNGEKIRGFRANVLLIDEMLLMGEDIVQKVLMPFIVAPQHQTERQIIRAKEDDLIRRGKMLESQRKEFVDISKFIAFSSASYTCEYLYRKYDEFHKKIFNPPKDEPNAKYFIAQMAFDGVDRWKDRLEKVLSQWLKVASLIKQHLNENTGRSLLTAQIVTSV